LFKKPSVKKTVGFFEAPLLCFTISRLFKNPKVYQKKKLFFLNESLWRRRGEAVKKLCLFRHSKTFGLSRHSKSKAFLSKKENRRILKAFQKTKGFAPSPVQKPLVFERRRREQAKAQIEDF
jgi:hypothetical protein